MTLFTQLIGEGRPDVVFLHGLFGRGKNWAGIARQLAATGHASVLFDLPNHGQSHWTETFDYVGMADEVADELRLRLGSAAHVNLVGHSMGGKVAMLIALRHPDVARRLVVVDIAPALSAGVEAQKPYAAAMRSLDLHALTSRSDADAALTRAIPSQSVRQFLMQNLKLSRDPEERNRWNWELNLELLGDHMDAVAAWPSVDAHYQGPVLWVGGRESTYIRPEHEPLMRRLFPNVRLVWIADAGHWVHADAPQALTAALREFIAG